MRLSVEMRDFIYKFIHFRLNHHPDLFSGFRGLDWWMGAPWSGLPCERNCNWLDLFILEINLFQLHTRQVKIIMHALKCILNDWMKTLQMRSSSRKPIWHFSLCCPRVFSHSAWLLAVLVNNRPESLHVGTLKCLPGISCTFYLIRNNKFYSGSVISPKGFSLPGV